MLLVVFLVNQRQILIELFNAWQLDLIFRRPSLIFFSSLRRKQFFFEITFGKHNPHFTTWHDFCSTEVTSKDKTDSFWSFTFVTNTFISLSSPHLRFFNCRLPVHMRVRVFCVWLYTSTFFRFFFSVSLFFLLWSFVFILWKSISYFTTGRPYPVDDDGNYWFGA